ncbi:MAG: cation:proton antiporter [bacterium]
MPQVPIVGELLIVAIAAVLVASLLSRLRFPVIAGVIAAGAIVGPHGLRLVGESATIEMLAHLGVVLLLFTIGLEFSLERVGRIGGKAVLSGLLQVAATVGAVAAGAVALGFSPGKAFFFGMVFALSSTAIVLRLLDERGEVDAPHGRLVVATLIVQDLAVIPMIVLIPMLSGKAGGAGAVEAMFLVLKGAALVAVAVIAAKYLIPGMMRLVSATKSREVFLLSVLILGLGAAWLSVAAGLSPALGAFLAGIVLAESEFAHRALAEVLPLRDLLTSVFFALMGMLFDWRILVNYAGPVAGLFLALVLGKSAIAAIGALLLRFPARVAILTGLGLAQFGEFGYVLLDVGMKSNLATAEERSVIVVAGVVTMFLTPLVIKVAPRIAAGERLLRNLELAAGIRTKDEPEAEYSGERGHVIVAGQGPSGRMLVEVLKVAGIPYVGLELNAETVRDLRKHGEPVIYADVTSREALTLAGIEHARALAIIVSDDAAVGRAIKAARDLRKDVPVIVRTRYKASVERLLKLGANVVVVEELEAAKAIVEHVCGALVGQGESCGDAGTVLPYGTFKSG